MESFGIYEAKAKLSELVDQAAAGREVVLTRHGEPVAKIVPVGKTGKRERARAMRELLELSRTIKLRRRITWREAINAGRR